MNKPLTALEQRRAAILHEVAGLGDFRPGSISATGGRCGNPRCHCHRPGDPGHGPHLRLTYKANGRSVSESFASPAAERKAEREIRAFRRYKELSRSFIEVNEQICHLRPVEATLTPQEKKLPRRSSKKLPPK